MVASASSDNSILVWLLPEGQLIYKLEIEVESHWVIISIVISMIYFYLIIYIL